MQVDQQRVERVLHQMRVSGLDALLCRLPHNVLMLTGYAPVGGDSFALFPLEGEPVLVVPREEEVVARNGWVKDVRLYAAESLSQRSTVLEAVEPILSRLTREKGLLGGVVGYEHDYDAVPSSATQLGVTSPATLQLFREAFGDADWKPADGDLKELGAVLTEREVDLVRLANLVAAHGVDAARGAIRPGVRECDVAAAVADAVLRAGHRTEPVRRVMVFPHVVSGPRAELAAWPHAFTTGRRLDRGDQVVVQIEVYVDGFWACVARTFFVGEPNSEQRAAYESCLDAGEMARQVERPGVSAAGVDIAARTVLTRRGYGEAFRHGLGHGVGFQAISRHTPPRLHPLSGDVMREGMVHTAEPSVYMPGFGVRIVDDLLVTDGAPEQLTPLEKELDWAVLSRRRATPSGLRRPHHLSPSPSP